MERNFACVEEQEDINCEGTLVKALPCPERMMKTPLPEQSSFSSMLEGSPWSAQERTTVARIEQYVNNSDCRKLDIDEVEEHSLGPEYSDVDVKHIFKKCGKRRQNIASKWRWDD